MKEKITRHRVQKVAEDVWNYSLNKWGLEFSDESRENLVRANELLKTNSLVFYINHTSTFPDVVLPTSMVMAYMPNAKRRLAPVAERHYSWRRDPLNAMALRLIGSVGGIDLFPVVQSEKLDEKAAKYSPFEKQVKTDRVVEVMKNIVVNPGAVFGIAPEATRTNGQLIKGERGLGMFSRYDREGKLRYSHLAIAMGQFHNEQPRVVFGEPLALHEIFERINVKFDSIKDPRERIQQITDVHMMRLAQDLPEEMKGYYGEVKD